MENNSAILDRSNDAPAKNAIFPRKSCAIIAINVNEPPMSPPCLNFFFRPEIHENCFQFTIRLILILKNCSLFLLPDPAK